ncbi:MAG TPA: hypothetical protein VFA07_15190 [Chthonomonadaceae bacterium]|nr:hypothetical protein [Chthonomonadaceae bacterium]
MRRQDTCWMRLKAQTRILAQTLFVICAVMGTSAQAIGQGLPAWAPKTFPIGGWCSPPEPYITTEQYKRLADAGFTIVMPPCDGEATVARNRKILDTAKAAGLRAIISDARMPLAITGHAEAEKALKAIVADYHRHPALLGYFLTDEPSADQFAGLAEVVAALHKLDPDHLVYINLYPNYASNNLAAHPSQLGTDNYTLYLQQFAQTVKPDLLSFDFYGFMTSGDRSGFYGNLAAAQRALAAAPPQTPLWPVILSVQHGPYRALNENELRYEALQALVYGAQGLTYFTYWLPQDDKSYTWSHGIMNRDGTPGPLYEAVSAVNRQVRDLGKWLYGARVLTTFQTGDVPSDGRAQENDVPVKVMGPGNLSVGLFRDLTGYLYVLVTNRDYTKPVSTKVLLDAGDHALEALDQTKNRWNPTTGPKDADGQTTLDLDLPPAGAAMIRWQ